MKDFPLGRYIAHAGGAISERRYTNSLEAFELSAPIVPIVELDVVQALDGIIVAHDGQEKAYGLKSAFSDISIKEFETCRYAGAFSVMSLDTLCARMVTHKSHVVLDLKSSTDVDYRNSIAEVARVAFKHGVEDKLVPQVYSPDNYDAVLEQGLRNTILALWKNYGNVRTDRAKECVTHCFSNKTNGFQALSVAARHFVSDNGPAGHDLSDFFFECSESVFLHGQKPEEEEGLISRGFGLFSHYAVDWVKRFEDEVTSKVNVEMQTKSRSDAVLKTAKLLWLNVRGKQPGEEDNIALWKAEQEPYLKQARGVVNVLIRNGYITVD